MSRQTALIAPFFFFLSCTAGLAGWSLERFAKTATDALPIYLPDSQFLRVVSLGYHNVMADLLWFRTISYFGEHYRSDRTYPWLAHMCDRVTDLDPKAFYVYRFAGMILPWEANQVDEGLRLLEKGSHVLPDRWELPYWTGFSYFLFKNDLEAAVRNMKRAILLPGAPSSAMKLFLAFQKHHSGARVALEFLKELQDQSDSKEMRQAMEERRKEAQLAADIEDLTHAANAFERKHGRRPGSLQEIVTSGLLREIPVPPFGGHYLIGPAGEIVTSTGHRPLGLYRSRTGEELLKRGAR